MAEFSKTIDNLVDILLARVKGGSGSTDPLYSQALTDLNLALQDLAAAHAWKWLRKEATVTVPIGTRLLNNLAGFPTDAVNFTGLSYGSTVLSMITEDELNDLYPDKTAQGNPIHYIIGPLYQASTSVAPVRSIEIRPTPIEQITLEISYTSTFKQYTTAEKNEVPPIPQNYYSLLIELASARFSSHLSRPRAQIQGYEITAARLMDRLAKTDADRNKQKQFRLPVQLLNYRANRYKLHGRRFT